MKANVQLVSRQAAQLSRAMCARSARCRSGTMALRRRIARTGYSDRDADAWALPLRAAGAQLTGLPPKTRKRRRKTLNALAGATGPP